MSDAVAKPLLVKDFVSLIKKLNEVRAVRVSFEEGLTRLWTYLDGHPFEIGPRYQVYRAEKEILRRYPGAEIDLYLRMRWDV